MLPSAVVSNLGNIVINMQLLGVFSDSSSIFQEKNQSVFGYSFTIGILCIKTIHSLAVRDGFLWLLFHREKHLIYSIHENLLNIVISTKVKFTILLNTFYFIYLSWKFCLNFLFISSYLVIRMPFELLTISTYCL